MISNEELDDLLLRLRLFEGSQRLQDEAAAALKQLRSERDALEIECNVHALATKAKAEELAALRKKIEEAEPTAWCDVNEISFVSDDFRQNTHSSMAAYHHVPLYTLEGIKE